MRKWIAAIICFIMLMGIAVGILYKYRILNNSGTVKAIGIEVYKDADGTIQLTNIDWGIIEPGQNMTYIIYVKNEGNTNVTLSKVESDWTPVEASTYVSLEWDYNGSIINPKSMIPITLTLRVSIDISGIEQFTFNTTIVGTET